MTRILVIVSVLTLVLAAGAFLRIRSALAGGVQMAEESEVSDSFWDLKTRDLHGVDTKLSPWAEQVALVVNVASECGLTPQYEGLETLQEELGSRGFTVLGFPSNDFGGQEPGTPDEIREFCSTTYGVSFPLFEKRHVKGEEMDSIYRFLTRNLDEPSWNFTKYLVDHEGRVVGRFGPKTEPGDAGLREEIEKLLAARKASGA